MFTEPEIRWLLQSHSFPETRGGIRGFLNFKELIDFRKLGGRNVDEVFAKVMWRRAVALGRHFMEYRKTFNAFSKITTTASSLESEIEAQKLF